MRNPPRMRGGRKKSRKREEGGSCGSLYDLENPRNLVLKEEEEEY